MNIIFSDGSFKPAPKNCKFTTLCGCGVVVISNSEIIDMNKIKLPGKQNNYAELYGVYEGLKLLKKHERHKDFTVIITDSNYSVLVLTDTMILEGKNKGLKKEWTTKEGKTLKNQELIKKIYKLIVDKKTGDLKDNIRFIHINSHMKKTKSDDISRIRHGAKMAGFEITKKTAENFIEMNNTADKLAKSAVKELEEETNEKKNCDGKAEGAKKRKIKGPY